MVHPGPQAHIHVRQQTRGGGATGEDVRLQQRQVRRPETSRQLGAVEDALQRPNMLLLGVAVHLDKDDVLRVPRVEGGAAKGRATGGQHL